MKQQSVSILLFIASFLLSPGCRAQNTVITSDDLNSYTDLKNGTDYDSASERAWMIRWNLDRSGADIHHDSNQLLPQVTPGQTVTVPLTLPPGAKPLEMVLIPSGTFMMGSPNNEQDRDSDEGPQHQVTLTKAFYMGKYEVTQAQYQAVMGTNPSNFSGKPNHPVEGVSWYDAVKFCNALSRKENRTPVYNESTWVADWNVNGYRLPTEAEWEYACRANTTTRFYWGDDLNYTQIQDYAWYDGNNNPNGTKEVGLKKPNAWGLFDMSGNVWEWCWNWYGSSYDINDSNDPHGNVSGSFRVRRGGGWSYVSWYCRSAFHNTWWPDFTSNVVGFRMVSSQTL